MRAAARSLGEDGLFLCQGICGNFSRVHADPCIKRYIFPNSMLPSLARLTRAAEGVFIVEDVKNIGPNYDPTLIAWEENFRRAWPHFADRYGDRFRRMWRFYLLSCAGAFRARSLHVFSISELALLSRDDRPNKNKLSCGYRSRASNTVEGL
jgi:cyclopropane-fatty-acyl-phospholipid synthase